MHRRQLLRTLVAAAVSVPTGLLLLPRKARAIGGTLPELEAPAPGFRLDGVVPRNGKAVAATLSLSDFAGQWLVLYFYPRDFTGGCTLEARGFQRDLEAYRSAHAAVVGVSADDPDSHASFCSEEGLAFPLLSDPGGQVSRRYGSWIPPFSQRHTFLIDPAGVLKARWLGVRPASHSAEVLTELRHQQSELSSPA